MSDSKRNWIFVGMTAVFYGCLVLQNFYSRKS